MSGRVLLLRHPPVARAWAGRCYGRSDTGWSRDGRAAARRLAELLTAEPIGLVVHSGARRCAPLAAAVATRRGCPVRADPRWLERDFGAWEGRSWDAIWRESGDLMDRMATDPHGFRPGGGETGEEVTARAAAAWADLPADAVTLVVSHGGPIAYLRARLAGAPLEEAARFIPAPGEPVEVRPPNARGG